MMGIFLPRIWYYSNSTAGIKIQWPNFCRSHTAVLKQSNPPYKRLIVHSYLGKYFHFGESVFVVGFSVWRKEFCENE